MRGGGCEIFTWNTQRMSVRGNNRMRRVVDRIAVQGWELVCLTELKLEGEGVALLGEDEYRVAVVHGWKRGVLLRGEALEVLRNEGNKTSFT